jgi:hypothetical protein
MSLRRQREGPYCHRLPLVVVVVFLVVWQLQHQHQQLPPLVVHGFAPPTSTTRQSSQRRFSPTLKSTVARNKQQQQQQQRQYQTPTGLQMSNNNPFASIAASMFGSGSGSGSGSGGSSNGLTVSSCTKVDQALAALADTTSTDLSSSYGVRVPSWSTIRENLSTLQTPEERAFRDNLKFGYGVGSPLHKIRLYNDHNKEEDIQVIFYRDHASWCKCFDLSIFQTSDKIRFKSLPYNPNRLTHTHWIPPPPSILPFFVYRPLLSKSMVGLGRKTNSLSCRKD